MDKNEYEKIKNEMALFLLIQAVHEELEKAKDSDNEEYKVFVTKIEVIKDILINL